MKNSLMAVVALSCMTLNPLAALANDDAHVHHQHHSQHEHSYNAPIGVMGDHIHEDGDWMFSYRYMYMNMAGMGDEDSDLSAQDVFSQGYMITPVDMQTEMHMFGAMYAPSNRTTLMIMLPYLEKEMKHQTMGNAIFSTKAKGFGDTKVTGLIKAYQNGNHQVHFNAGVSLPTGSITERDVTPASSPNKAKLPYAMQLGSGTFDLMPGITYNGHAGAISWGGQFRTELHLGRNDEGYSLGDLYETSTWVSYGWTKSLSTSARIKAYTLGDINGRDGDLNANMVPTADPDNYGKKQIDLSLGVNLLGQQGAVKGHSVALEASLPLYQHLNGPQMQSDWMVTLGWQKSF